MFSLNILRFVCNECKILNIFEIQRLSCIKYPSYFNMKRHGDGLKGELGNCSKKKDLWRFFFLQVSCLSIEYKIVRKAIWIRVKSV